MKLFIQVLLLICSLKGKDTCNPAICLRWTVTWQRFTLICQVTELNHTVIIEDQNGNIASLCIPPHPFKTCDSRIRGGSVFLRLDEKEMIFSLIRTDTKWHINGNWTCRHGTSLDIAFIEVTVLEQIGAEHRDVNHTKDNITTTKSNGPYGYRVMDFIINGICGYGMGFVLTLLTKRCVSKSYNIEDGVIISNRCHPCLTAKGLKTIILVITSFLMLLICGLLAYHMMTKEDHNSHFYMLITGVPFGAIFGFAFACIKDDNTPSQNGGQSQEGNETDENEHSNRVQNIEMGGNEQQGQDRNGTEESEPLQPKIHAGCSTSKI